MKAIVYTEYGTPDVLQLKEIEKPIPADDEVLVKVHAASVNSWDWDLLRGKPFLIRMWGLLKPKYNILGSDIAGIIEAVGRNVTQFRPGDEVFGDITESGWGGFAEYACAREDNLILKPAIMTFEEAASIPQAGVLALQGLHDETQIQPGHKVLINGAGGGVGTLAIQIARSMGAEVTGVDSTEKLDTMRSAGADHVIDYTKEDFTKNGQQYDFILDVAAHHSILDSMRALSPNGIYVIVGGSTAIIFQIMLLGPLLSMIGSRKMSVLMHKPNKDLAYFTQLFEAGKVVPVIDKRYTLEEVPEALRHLGEGHAKGKVVINME